MSKKDDATQSGVSSEQERADEHQEQQPQDRPKSMRDLGMELMEQRRREELAAEGVEIEAPTEEKTEGAGEDLDQQITQQTRKTEQEETTTADPDAEAAAAAAASSVAPQMVKVKIDGKEEMVPLDKVVAQYQKGTAADYRLEEATKLLAEARAEREKAATEKEKAEADKKIAAAEGGLNAVKANFFDAVYAGESEKAKEALDKIIEESVTAHLKGRGNATSDEEIVARVAPAVEQSLEAKSALRKFQKDYKQIAFDPYLAAKADTFLKESLAAGKAYEEALKEAGDKTLGWMRDTLGIKSAVTTSTAVSERTERKKGIDNPPSTSAKTPTPQESPQEQNVQSSIAEMRSKRVASG